MKPGAIMFVALVAFAGLCAAGFWWLRPQPLEPPSTLAPPSPVPAPAPRPTPTRPTRPEPPAAAARPARVPEPKVIAPRMPGPSEAKPLHPAYAPLAHPEVLPLDRFRTASDPVKALAPLVHDCFADARAQYRGKLSATLKFTPLPDGGIARGSVEAVSVEDPYIEACLEDAMEDARYAPGELSDPIEHTFTFGGEDAGSGAGLR